VFQAVVILAAMPVGDVKLNAFVVQALVTV